MKSRYYLNWLIAIPVTVLLAASGCATKKYVRNTVAPVNQKLAKVEHQTNEKIANLAAKHDRDISQVNERISTTDQRVAEVAEATQQAQGTASRAMDATEKNAAAISANSAAVSDLASDTANALNYQMVQKSDVMFGFNKATLTPEAKAALDQIAAKQKSMPRSIVELAGFTDPVGSTNYNLALSRRRAEAVQRYLVDAKVPVRSIHFVGMGKQAPPPGFGPDTTAVKANPTKSELHQLARRVQIRLWAAGDITQGTASRSDQ